MADYERRLQRLEDRAAATGKWPYPYVTREMIEKRNAELSTPKELLAIRAEIAADPEGSKAEVEAILARVHAEVRRLTATNENDS